MMAKETITDLRLVPAENGLMIQYRIKQKANQPYDYDSCSKTEVFDDDDQQSAIDRFVELKGQM